MFGVWACSDYAGRDSKIPLSKSIVSEPLTAYELDAIDRPRKIKILKKGTHTGSPCGLSLPCGNCAGICLIRFNATAPEFDESSATFVLMNDSTMRLYFENDFFLGANHTVTIQSDIIFDELESAAFGKNMIKIPAGNYSLQASVNPHGYISINVVTE